MRILAAGLMVGLFSVVAVGQATAPEQKTAAAQAALQGALDKAKAESRVLLVTFGSDAGRAKANEQLLSIPAVAGWIERHAAVHAVGDVGVIRLMTENKLTQAAGGDPLFFVDGALAAFSAGSSVVIPKTGVVDPKTVTGRGSIALAMRLDWTLRSPNVKEEFFKRHEAALPARVWPVVSEKPAALLGPLAAARSLAKEKKWDQAANAYANLWMETAGAAWAAPVRVGTMAAEMGLIAQQSAAAKDRFEGVRGEYARGVNLRDMRQVHEYLILCRVVGDHEHNLRFLDEVTQSKSAVLMIPTNDLVSVEWMLPRCHWNDPTEGISEPGAWCVQTFRVCDKMEGRKPEVGKGLASPAEAVAYGRWLARVEAGRRYAALLGAADEGRRKKAAELRAAVLAADASVDLRSGMAAAALAAGHRPADLAELLAGVNNPELAAEIGK